MLNLSGPRTMPLEMLKTTYFVRTMLNQDHVLYLADLYENGVALPPIIITKTLEVLDGRHRLQAMRLLGWTESQAYIVEAVMTPEEMLIEALRANMDGKLTMTQKDIELVIHELIKLGIRPTKIAALLPFPKPLADKYINVVKKRQERMLVTEAIDAIASGSITVSDAAVKYGIAVATLQEGLGLRKKQAEPEIRPILSSLAVRVRGVSQRMGSITKELTEAYLDGTMSASELQQFISLLKESAAKLKRVATHNEDRLRQVLNGATPRSETQEVTE